MCMCWQSDVFRKQVALEGKSDHIHVQEYFGMGEKISGAKVSLSPCVNVCALITCRGLYVCVAGVTGAAGPA